MLVPLSVEIKSERTLFTWEKGTVINVDVCAVRYLPNVFDRTYCNYFGWAKIPAIYAILHLRGRLLV